MFEKVVNINLVGTFNVCRLIAAHIIANAKDASEKEGIYTFVMKVKVEEFKMVI